MPKSKEYLSDSDSESDDEVLAFMYLLCSYIFTFVLLTIKKNFAFVSFLTREYTNCWL